jgi:hypothetical protein
LASQIERRLFRPRRRRGLPFDGVLDGAPHLIKPPLSASAHSLASPKTRAHAAGGGGAGNPSEAEIKLSRIMNSEF